MSTPKNPNYVKRTLTPKAISPARQKVLKARGAAQMAAEARYLKSKGAGTRTSSRVPANVGGPRGPINSSRPAPNRSTDRTTTVRPIDPSIKANSSASRTTKPGLPIGYVRPPMDESIKRVSKDPVKRTPTGKAIPADRLNPRVKRTPTGKAKVSTTPRTRPKTGQAKPRSITSLNALDDKNRKSYRKI